MARIKFTDSQSRIPNPKPAQPRNRFGKKSSSTARSHRAARHHALREYLHYVSNCATHPRVCPAPWHEDAQAKLVSVRNQVQFVYSCGSNVTGLGASVPLPLNFVLPLGLAQSQVLAYGVTDATGMTSASEDSASTFTSMATLGVTMGTTNGTYERGRCTAIEARIQFMGPPATATGRVFVAKSPQLGSWGYGVKGGSAADMRSNWYTICGSVGGAEYDVYTAAELYQSGGLVLKYFPTSREELMLISNTFAPGSAPATVNLLSSGIPLAQGAKGISVSTATALLWSKVWFADMQTNEKVQVTINIGGDLDCESYSNASVSSFAHIARASIGHPNTLQATQWLATRHMTGDTTNNATFKPAASTSNGKNLALAALDLHTLYGDAPAASDTRRAGPPFVFTPNRVAKTKVLYASNPKGASFNWKSLVNKAYEDALEVVNRSSRAFQGELGERAKLREYMFKKDVEAQARKDAIREKLLHKFRYRKPGVY